MGQLLRADPQHNMWSKKLRLDIISDDEKKKIIQGEICQIEKSMRVVLAKKDGEIWENKLAISAVARENKELQKQLLETEKEINEQKGELADCYGIIEQKDEEIGNIHEEKNKKESEFNECKKTYQENYESYHEMLVKREMELSILQTELTQSRNKVKEVASSSKANEEKQTKKLSFEKDRTNNLENSFIVASTLFFDKQFMLEYNLVLEEEKNVSEIETEIKKCEIMEKINAEFKEESDQLLSRNNQLGVEIKRLNDVRKQLDETNFKYVSELKIEKQEHKSTKHKLEDE